jgi:hypothetical protein
MVHNFLALQSCVYGIVLIKLFSDFDIFLLLLFCYPLCILSLHLRFNLLFNFCCYFSIPFRLYCKKTSELKEKNIGAWIISENRYTNIYGMSQGKLTFLLKLKKKNLRGLSPLASSTNRVTAACRRSYCQLMRLEGFEWSAQRIPPAVFSDFLTGPITFPFK